MLAWYMLLLGVCVRLLQHTHTHTHLTALFPGLPRRAGTRKVKPIWISLKQETVSGSSISWAICKSAPCSRQITTPAPHHSVVCVCYKLVFYQNGWTDPVVFWLIDFFRPMCYKKIQMPPKIKVLLFWNVVPNSDLQKFLPVVVSE